MKYLKTQSDTDNKLPKNHEPMINYQPLPLFKAYDSNLDDCILPGKLPSTMEDLRKFLVMRYEFQDNGIWRCFSGYGDSEMYGGKCPLCGGKLIAEASVLTISNIEIYKGVKVPVLLCLNCCEAIDYSNEVYFCKSKDDNRKLTREEVEEQIRCAEVLHICFIRELERDIMIFPINMTIVHRKIILSLLHDKEFNSIESINFFRR